MNTVREAFDHEQVRHLGLVRRLRHPAYGPVSVVGPPVEFVGAGASGGTRPPPPLRNDVRSAPPTLGQHTRGGFFCLFLHKKIGRLFLLIQGKAKKKHEILVPKIYENLENVSTEKPCEILASKINETQKYYSAKKMSANSRIRNFFGDKNHAKFWCQKLMKTPKIVLPKRPKKHAKFRCPKMTDRVCPPPLPPSLCVLWTINRNKL